MEVKIGLLTSCLLMFLFLGAFSLEMTASSLQITRKNIGDTFIQGSVTPTDLLEGRTCSEELCIGLSSGTATSSGPDNCTCQCHPHLPAFREDLSICVDDIHECVLAPFVGGSTSQQIPFVYLPCKGQIIHPSKEISFAGIKTPVCAVSGAKFLTESGWVDLRNPVDTDVPFRLFRDQGRTFLKWYGEPELRTKMSGRLLLVYLMCRDLASPELDSSPEETAAPVHALFSPCVAFRVVGTPTKYLNNVSEVAFAPDAHAASGSSSSHLSISEYIAIGICSLLLGLIYVASVFLYLHLKKRNSLKNKAKKNDTDDLNQAEEGVIKNNPLLSMVNHFQSPDNGYSDSASSDTDATADIVQNNEDRKKHMQMQITSALIHPQLHQRYDGIFGSVLQELAHQESSIECLPEENVSIVETLECREDRPDNLRALSGTVRKKLYFNPAYFEPQLLMAPPPAAIEFLYKIREVITIAKQKMESKRFTPSLIVIPEEEYNINQESYEVARPVTRNGSVISLKRENSRRKTCTGCPGCEPQDFRTLCGRLPEFPALAACHNCVTSNDSKQISIRKWLEDVPILKDEENQHSCKNKVTKRVRSPTRSLQLCGIKTSERAISPRPSSDKAASERATSPDSQCSKSKSSTKSRRLRKSNVKKPKLPPPPIPFSPGKKEKEEENHYDIIPAHEEAFKKNLPHPDMINEAMVVDNNKVDITNRIPTLTKKQMNAVINELTVHRNNLINEEPPRRLPIEYETDSLERNAKGYHTPSEYAEVISSQPSPSLSTALPMDEEMTMRNAIFNKKTGNMTISKLNNNKDSLQEDDHDYELIVMKKGTSYRLPELLQRNNGYSLVSEVYVNNGYNYGSNPSSPSDSNCSTLEERTLKVRYDGGKEKPGKLLIEVEDCADNYIPVDDSDSFEADTLDRKSNKLKLPRFNIQNKHNEFVDSLERPPNQILLKTTGSFRREPIVSTVDDDKPGTFNRAFGSLREIFEAKKNDENTSLTIISDDEGRLLTLEERHSRRQRKLNIKEVNVQPDVIPPPPHDNTPIYEHPKPPRKVIIDENGKIPPLPPKNGKRGSVKTTTPQKTSTKDTPVKIVENNYEFCLVQKNKKDGNILTSLIQAEDIILKKGANDQFILHNTNNINFGVPIKSLQSFMPIEDLKNRNKVKKSWRSANKPEDSGYLSTDSNDSLKKKIHLTLEPLSINSETDESLGDGHSESGGESVETHSVFFGSFQRKPLNFARYDSVDSGVINGDGPESTDSENISYTTVVQC